MKNVITWILLLALCTSASAQVAVSGFGFSRGTSKSTQEKEPKEYRFKKNNGKLIIEMNNVQIEGYDGNEVVISMLVAPQEVDERAAGLVGISGSGLRDNTGMGIYVGQDNDIADIRLLKNLINDTIQIKIPQQLSVSVLGTRAYGQGGISLKDIQGEIEVSASMSNVKLEGVTGPMTVKTGHGNIEAVLNSPVKGPISLMSTSGFVDIAVPVATRADVEIASTFGEILMSEDFNIQIAEAEKPADNSSNWGWVSSNLLGDGRVEVRSGGRSISGEEVAVKRDSTSNNLTYTVSGSPTVFFNRDRRAASGTLIGTINGGGEKIILRTGQGKIYFRTAEK